MLYCLRGVCLTQFGYDLDLMSRLLTLLMIFVLVMAHGASVSAAICRHQDGIEHAAALRSEDSGISTVAYSEESAARSGFKKGAPADSGSVSWPSDMLPAPGLTAPFRAPEPVERNFAEAAILVGASVRPLLEPPSACARHARRLAAPRARAAEARRPEKAGRGHGSDAARQSRNG